VKCLAYKARNKGSLLGFADLEMKGGLILCDCTVHESRGTRWVSPPGKPMIGADGAAIRKDGKTAYAPVVRFASKEVRDLWSNAAVRAIAAFLGQAPSP